MIKICSHMVNANENVIENDFENRRCPYCI